MTTAESLAAAKAEALKPTVATAGTDGSDDKTSASGPGGRGPSAGIVSPDVSTAAPEGSADPQARDGATNGATSSSNTETQGRSTPVPAGTDGAQSSAADGASSQGDPRLLALAKADQRNREQAKKQREELEATAAAQRSKIEAGELLTKAQAAWRAGNPLAALEALGFSADDVYAPAAIDSYLGRAKPPTPEEAAERVVERRLAAERRAREEEAARVAAESQGRVREQYINGARRLLRAEAEKYPALVRALGTGEVEASEIADAGQVYFEQTGKTPEFSTILGFIESELNKSKPQTAPKIEAARAQPKPPVSTSNAPPAPVRPMTREESLAAAKREAGLSI